MKQLMKMTMSCVVPALLVIRVTCWSANTATDPASPFSSPCKVEELSSCKLHDYVSKNVRRWKHPLSRLVARSGVPTHSVQDILLTEGSPVVVEGKFTYGDLSKDLEDEPVLGFLDTSSGWVPLGEGSTDDNGRVEFTISQPLNIGVYSVQLEVEGDASLAESLLWVLPQGTHLSIFDIDGTLTKSDKEIVRSIETDLFLPLLQKQYVPKAYPGAVSLTAAQAARGYVNVYVTGRPYWFTKTTRAWLSHLSFARGVLHVTDSNREAAPTPEGVGAFKRNFLKKLVDAGFILDVAHGNATTDIDAYLGAGLAPDAVWIIGKHGGEKETHAVKDSWEARTREVIGLPSVSQPWQSVVSFR